MPGQWKKVPEENKKIIDEALKGLPMAERKVMFGCPAYFLNGHMFAGTFQDDIFIRLSVPDRSEILENGGASPFTPLPGRTMKEYVVIPPAVYKSESAFSSILHRSIEYVAALPPKEAGKKKGKKPR